MFAVLVVEREVVVIPWPLWVIGTAVGLVLIFLVIFVLVWMRRSED
jgi:hypothetical protein